MIRSITLKDVWGVRGWEFLERLPALGFLKEGKLEFTEGINVLHAPNGGGKSTILRVMSEVTGSYQGGVSTLTNDWLGYEVVRAMCKGMESPLEWDGGCVLYSNPRNAVGLIGGAAFDSDFSDIGISNCLSKSSTGLTTLERQLRVLEILLGKQEFPTGIVDKVRGFRDSECAFVKGNIPKGNPTIIFDEPESGFSIAYQQKLFEILSDGVGRGFQIIIATHSPFGLLLKGNHINLEKGHRLQQLGILLDVFNSHK